MQTTINGCPVYYEIYRNVKADAPRILFLHGWGCDSTTFSFIQSAVTEHATVATLDFPGHGKSAEPPVPWGVADYAQQVYTLITQNNLAPVKVVAHSFGGRVALMLAATHPDAVEQLVITGGAGLKKPVSQHAKKRSDRYRFYTAVLNGVKRIPFLSKLALRLQDKLRNRFGSPDYVKLTPAMRQTFVKVITEDLFPLLSRVHAPTLLVWGSADTETPLWMGEVMEKEIPDAGLVVFEGGSHFAFMEQWQRFVTIINHFFMEEHT